MTDQNRGLRDDLLHALDHAYVVGPLGFDTPEALLAAYDASRAVPVPPTADQTALRDRIADIATPFFANFSDEESARVNAKEFAAAVMAVLPEQTDRSAVYRYLADQQTQLAVADDLARRRDLAAARRQLVRELRRVAAEEQPTETQAHPPHDSWLVEWRAKDGDWAVAYPTHDHGKAVDRLARGRREALDWQWRLVRETSTYTVEAEHTPPAVGEQPETQETQHLGGRANAEDCPACEGTNPPYPFLCPGPDAP